MHNESNIRFINTHSESNGSHNHQYFIIHPIILCLIPFIFAHLSMIHSTLQTHSQFISYILTIFNSATIYDSSLIWIDFSYKLHYFFNCLTIFLSYLVDQIRSIK
jgi:hypothetical protein